MEIIQTTDTKWVKRKGGHLWYKRNEDLTERDVSHECAPATLFQTQTGLKPFWVTPQSCPTLSYPIEGHGVRKRTQHFPAQVLELFPFLPLFFKHPLPLLHLLLPSLQGFSLSFCFGEELGLQNNYHCKQGSGDRVDSRHWRREGKGPRNTCSGIKCVRKTQTALVTMSPSRSGCWSP